MARTDTASKIIKASPTQIYQAFLNSKAVLKWLPPAGMRGEIHTYEPKPGGKIHLTLWYQDSNHSSAGKTSENSDVMRGRFVELVSGKRIVQVFEFDSQDPAFAGAMTMSWHLQPVAEGTEVRIVCENVPPGIRKEDHEVGMSSTLANLATYAESKI